MRWLAWLFWVVAGLGVLISAPGCTRGADEARLRQDTQERLDQGVKPGLLKVVGLRREGSAPLPASESGAQRVVVYFNTTLEVAEDHRFGGWDQIGASSVAFALGATENGIFGVQPENRAGDRLRAYGSATYEQDGDAWVPVAAAPPKEGATAAAAAPDYDGTAPPSRSKQLIDQLAAMVELPPPGVPPQQDQIIAEELARASENIERRVQRREHTFTIASGPKDGQYARVADALIAAVHELAPNVKLRQRYTEGSVENAALLARGDADYAIIQGDVAAAAFTGTDVFARGGALEGLRAVGGLFPEPIQVVVAASSPIRDIAELRGRRVSVGTAASGTRYDAVAVLEAHGVNLADLAEARADTLDEAIARLRRGQVDALFVTAAAPAPPLQQLATGTGFRLLPITGAALDMLLATRPGLTSIVLPANTYPGQTHPAATVASAALFVTTVDAPDTEVMRVTDLVYNRMPKRGGTSAALITVSPENELRGVTIPLHPGAARNED
jgi:TRAP transporter TAXI family solute receptor